MTPSTSNDAPIVRRLPGRVAVVSGAARGLGAAIALRLASEGAAVAVVDLDAGRCAETVAAITAAGGVAAAFGCNVADSVAVNGLRDAVLARFGKADILVNNAGVLRDARMVDMSDDDWHVGVNVNLSSAFYMCRAFAPGMIDQHYGKIVNLSSRASLGSAGQANYSAAKAGISGFTATLAIELGPHNINVNAVGPGYFATPMTAVIAQRSQITHEQQQQEVAARTPLRRVGQPAELAAVVAFLASDDAAYVSGQTLFVNGGLITSGGTSILGVEPGRRPG